MPSAVKLRKFEYFLFENFDANKELHNPYNPRLFLTEIIDAPLSEILNYRDQIYPSIHYSVKYDSKVIQTF